MVRWMSIKNFRILYVWDNVCGFAWFEPHAQRHWNCSGTGSTPPAP